MTSAHQRLHVPLILPLQGTQIDHQLDMRMQLIAHQQAHVSHHHMPVASEHLIVQQCNSDTSVNNHMRYR